MSDDRGVTFAQVKEEVLRGENVYFYSLRGSLGTFCRKPKQCRNKHSVVVGEDKGVTLAQARGKG